MEYAEIARYYDLVHSRLIDYRAEAGKMDELFRPRGVRRILDLACGTGTHLLELARLGYQCVGTDLSADMIEIAREKARSWSLPVEFQVGNMCDYQLGQTFDAVLSLYALTTLIEDEAFRLGLDNARKALAPGGVFYFNLLNADSHGQDASSPSGSDPPGLYVDVVVNEPEIRLVRLNQTFFRGDIQDWTAIYLVDNGDGVKMISSQDQLRFHRLDWVEGELQQCGYEIRSVIYSDLEGVKNWDMFMLAEAMAPQPR